MRNFKEVQFRPNIAEHDYQTKLNRIKKFLEEGFQVRLVLSVRGRENQFKQEALNLLERTIQETIKLGKADTNKKQNGNDISVMISPFAKQHVPNKHENKYAQFSQAPKKVPEL